MTDLNHQRNARGWQVQFEAPVGERLKHRFIGITTYSAPNLWWHEKSRRWKPYERSTSAGEPVSSHAPCRSFKAFLRHLRRHPELRGSEVVLVSRWVGCNVVANSEASDAR